MAVASIRRATVLGLGRFGGGVAAARYLAHTGTAVTISDQASADELADSIAQLADVAIARWQLGGHCDRDVRDADLVVVNPAIPPSHPQLQLAQRLGVPVTTEIELFLQACPARVAGVTGTHGKSTTSAMLAAILEAAGMRVWLGGNIGGSLLGRLEEIAADDWCILELSSFQLWHFTAEGRMPHIAVVTNFTANHLDWHGHLDDYRRAKQRLIAQQQPGDFAVLNTHDAEVASWRPLACGHLVPLPPLEGVPPLTVPGEVNRINAACAAAAAQAAGCSATAIECGLAGFRGLPQRLEWFAVVDGRRFYNDSTATTPESAIAAIEALDVPVWLLGGGRSKGFDFRPLAEAIARRAAGAAFFGTARDELQQAALRERPTLACTSTEHLADALAWCFERSKPGEAIVLSPGCASTDQYRNFRERGERFVELVRALAGKIRP